MRLPRQRRAALAGCACVLLNVSSCSKDPAAIAIPQVDRARLEPAIARRVEEAERKFAGIDKEHADKALMGRAYGELGMTYHAQALLEPAEAAYRNAMALDPSSARWPYFLAHVYRDGGKFAPAAEMFTRALERDPSNVAAAIYLGDVLRQQGQFAEARRRYESALSVEGAKAAALAGLGKVSLAERRFPDAVKELEESLRLWPTASQLHSPLASAYRGLQNEARAEAEMRLHNPNGLEPGIPDPWIGELRAMAAGARVHLARGAKAFSAGRLDLAERSYRDAVEADPENAEAHLNLGVVLAQTGRLADAQRSLAMANKLDAGSALAALSLAMVYDRQGVDALATEQYQRAAALDPSNLKTKYFLAQSRMRDGRYKDAAVLLREVLARQPSEVPVAFALAACQVRLNQTDKARATLESALKVAPGHPALLNALARVLASSQDARVREPGRALALARELFARYRNGEGAQTLALALAANGQFGDAVTLQRMIIAKEREGNSAPPKALLLRNLSLYERGLSASSGWAEDDPWFRPRTVAETVAAK
jgi:cytochrome c-type biogenesis protein CcmH/NrfG